MSAKIALFDKTTTLIRYLEGLGLLGGVTTRAVFQLMHADISKFIWQPKSPVFTGFR